MSIGAFESTHEPLSDPRPDEGLASTARLLERALLHYREFSNRWSDRIQVRLRALEVKTDPEVARWRDRVRACVADGTIKQQLADQPDPQEVLEQWRRAHEGG